MEETHNTMNAITQDMLVSQTVFEQNVYFIESYKTPRQRPRSTPSDGLFTSLPPEGKGNTPSI